jgi:hypothetical protein
VFLLIQCKSIFHSLLLSKTCGLNMIYANKNALYNHELSLDSFLYLLKYILPFHYHSDFCCCYFPFTTIVCRTCPMTHRSISCLQIFQFFLCDLTCFSITPISNKSLIIFFLESNISDVVCFMFLDTRRQMIYIIHC